MIFKGCLFRSASVILKEMWRVKKNENQNLDLIILKDELKRLVIRLYFSLQRITVSHCQCHKNKSVCVCQWSTNLFYFSSLSSVSPSICLLFISKSLKLHFVCQLQKVPRSPSDLLSHRQTPPPCSKQSHWPTDTLTHWWQQTTGSDLGFCSRTCRHVDVRIHLQC